MAVYRCTTPEGKVRLVDAKTIGQATAHVLKDKITVEAINTTDLVKHLREGLTVETAAVEPAKAKEPKAEGAAAEKPAPETAQSQKTAEKEVEKKAGLFGGSHKKAS